MDASISNTMCIMLSRIAVADGSSGRMLSHVPLLIRLNKQSNFRDADSSIASSGGSNDSGTGKDSKDGEPWTDFFSHSHRKTRSPTPKLAASRTHCASKAAPRTDARRAARNHGLLGAAGLRAHRISCFAQIAPPPEFFACYGRLANDEGSHFYARWVRFARAADTQKKAGHCPACFGRCERPNLSTQYHEP